MIIKWPVGLFLLQPGRIFGAPTRLWACRWVFLADSINVSSQRGPDRSENWTSDVGTNSESRHGPLKWNQRIRRIKCLQAERWSRVMIPTRPPPKSNLQKLGLSPRQGRRDHQRCHFSNGFVSFCCTEPNLIAAHHFGRRLGDESNRCPARSGTGPSQASPSHLLQGCADSW